MIHVIHEEKDFVVVSKSAGLVTHPDGKTDTNGQSVSELIEQIYPEIKKIGEPLVMTGKGGEEIVIPRPGIVHRLDTETSGVMIIARTKKFFDFMKDQFQNHQVQKEYKAFVWGWFKKGAERGIINAPIGRSKTDFRQYSAGRFARGEMREAVTEYETLAQFETKKIAGSSITPRFSYMSVKPKTGRTHQIRVHMKLVNHVIVSDSLYASSHPKVLGFKRHALHAHIVSFVDMKGKQRVFEAPFPEDFNNAIQVHVGQL